MTLVAADSPSLEQAEELLVQAGLPTEDLADAPGLQLFGLRHDDRWIGVVGVQPLDGAALLRSLAVAPAQRGQGRGAALVAAAEAYANASGWAELFLLTTGAAAFFRRLGYEAISRDDAPAALRATRQFAQLCPATAQVMRKRLRVTVV